MGACAWCASILLFNKTIVSLVMQVIQVCKNCWLLSFPITWREAQIRTAANQAHRTKRITKTCKSTYTALKSGLLLGFVCCLVQRYVIKLPVLVKNIFFSNTFNLMIFVSDRNWKSGSNLFENTQSCHNFWPFGFSTVSRGHLFNRFRMHSP